MIFAIMVALLFLMAPVGAAHSQGIAASPPNFQPNVSLNTNITWSNFYSGYSPLEYNNGTGNQTLPTNMSTFYQNPITVNPTDIKSKALQNDNLSTGPVWDASAWVVSNLLGGAIRTSGISGTSIYQTVNTSDSAANAAEQRLTIPVTNFPSNNPNYNFVTAIIKLSGPQMNGVDGNILLLNSSSRAAILLTIYPGQYAYISESLGTIQKDCGYYTTFNTTGKGATRYLKIDSQIDLPETSTAARYNLSIIGMAFGTTPMTLGTAEKNGSLIQVNQLNEKNRLQTFNPDFTWTRVSNSGYTVATSQHLSQMENYSTIKTPISSGNYVEQVGYSGDFHLPAAPDLSYTGTNLSIGMNVPGKQIQVMDINGESYLNLVQNKTNGTIALISGLNPTTHISYLEYVNYTYSQWNSISSPPGAFSIAGIEYYYWIAIGAVAGLIGLGAASHRANVKGQQLREIRPPRGR